MDIHQESASDFRVGHGGADAVSRPIVEPEYSTKAYKGVRVRAASANTVVIYVGPAGVSEETGYLLPAGEELPIPIEQPSRIHVTASPADNCEQTVTLSGEIAGDTFTLAFEGETTEAIDVTAAAATVEAALLALSTIGAGNCSVSGSAGGPYTVEFTGDLAKTDVSLLVGVGAGVNETQTVGIDDGTTAGTFTLTFDGQTTDPAIAYNASAEDVEAALKLLSNIGDSDVSVSGGPGPTTDWVVEFTGALALTDVPAMTGDGSSLSGGSTDVTVTETQKGDATCSVNVEKTDITTGSQYSWLAV